jgi:hypothetical protein
VAQRHAEFFEIGVDQITEKFRVDFAVTKTASYWPRPRLRSQFPKSVGEPQQRKATIAQPTRPVERDLTPWFRLW